MHEIMAKFLRALVVLLLIVAVSAAQAPASKMNFGKRDKKLLAKQEKAEAKQRAWEIETRPPDPAYPASLRPEYVTALRQAAALIDNAFNSIPKSRFEFSIANQSAQQAAAVVRASAQGQGELQAADALIAYAQIVPICQEAAWDAVSNVFLLLSGNYRECQHEAARLRTVADRTVQRNSGPIPEAPLPLPVAQVEKVPPTASDFVEPLLAKLNVLSENEKILLATPLRFSLAKGQSSLAVRFKALRYETISIDVDGAGPSSDTYQVGYGASFVVSNSVRITALDLANVQIFVGDSPVGPLTGTTVEIVVQK